MITDDDLHSSIDHPHRMRMAEALEFGEYIDALFEQECIRHGLVPAHCLKAPLLALAGLPMTARIQ